MSREQGEIARVVPVEALAFAVVAALADPAPAGYVALAAIPSRRSWRGRMRRACAATTP